MAVRVRAGVPAMVTVHESPAATHPCRCLAGLQAGSELTKLLESDEEEQESEDSDIEAKFLAGLTHEQKKVRARVR